MRRGFWACHKIVWPLSLSMVVFLLNGCVYLMVGGIGAFGGYVASPDTVEGTVLERDYDTVWSQAVEVVSTMGMIEENNPAGGVLQADVQGTRVKITVLGVSASSVKLRIKARRSVFPKIRTAQQIYIKIVSALDVPMLDDV